MAVKRHEGGIIRQARGSKEAGKGEGKDRQKEGCKMTGKGADGDKQGGEKKAKGVVKR